MCLSLMNTNTRFTKRAQPLKGCALIDFSEDSFLYTQEGGSYQKLCIMVSSSCTYERLRCMLRAIFFINDYLLLVKHTMNTRKIGFIVFLFWLTRM
jgi:hypothetical protein